MTRRDWWIGIALVTAALLVHALVPRYTLSPYGHGVVRVDHWTGAVEVPRVQRPLVGQFSPADIDPPGR